jgi:hypothetical protein
MYQENVLRARHAEDAVGKATDHDRHRFAPAYDPFVTAAVVAEVVREHRKTHGSANVYLAPLSTKAQALGMGLYFLAECAQQAVPTSILYPSFRHHERETSTGVSGAWRYTVELP